MAIRSSRKINKQTPRFYFRRIAQEGRICRRSQWVTQWAMTDAGWLVELGALTTEVWPRPIM